jgi:hypothetical protein
MLNTPAYATAAVALDYERTLVLAIGLSTKSWVLAAQVPGPSRTKARQSIAPIADALTAAVGHYRERAAEARHTIESVIARYEGGWSGFWLARWLAAHGFKVHVVQPSSVLVDERMRRAKSDGIDGISPPSKRSGSARLELFRPECGTVVGPRPPDVRFAGRLVRTRAPPWTQSVDIHLDQEALM